MQNTILLKISYELAETVRRTLLNMPNSRMIISKALRIMHAAHFNFSKIKIEFFATAQMMVNKI